MSQPAFGSAEALVSSLTKLKKKKNACKTRTAPRPQATRLIKITRLRIPTGGGRPVDYLQAWPRSWTRGYRKLQLALRTRFEPLTYWHFKSDALTTRPRCLLIGLWDRVIFVEETEAIVRKVPLVRSPKQVILLIFSWGDWRLTSVDEWLSISRRSGVKSLSHSSSCLLSCMAMRTGVLVLQEDPGWYTSREGV